MLPFLYILSRCSLRCNTLSIFCIIYSFEKKSLLPPYRYKVSQKSYANTYATNTYTISCMAYHAMLQMFFNYPQSFPNLLRSEYSSHRNVFGRHLEKMKSRVKHEVIDSRLWLPQIPPGHTMAAWINISALE